MKKLLASDLDGTLIFENKISDQNKMAIHRLKHSGSIFAISTGRPFNGVEKVIETLEIDPDYLILNNGALILDGHKNIVYSNHIEFEIVKKIIENIVMEDWAVAVETGFTTFPIGNKEIYEERGFLSDIDITFNNVSYITSLEDVNHNERERLTLISLYNPNNDVEEVNEVCNNINKKFGDKVIAYRNNCFIDVVPKGCSKGSAVKFISDIAKIDIDKVYTIGDSWNDDSMFEITKNSFTFTYAEEALRDKTNYVVETVEECIEKYML